MVRSEALILDADINTLAKMNIDIELRKQWDRQFFDISIPEVYNQNEDLLYQVIKTPFPLANRDFLLRRFYVNNAEQPDEIEKVKLWKKPNKYWMFVCNSVENKNHPCKKGLVRADNLSAIIFEEDPSNPKNVIYKMVTKTDLKGNIPLWVLKNSVGKATAKVLDETIAAYRKNANAWNKTTP